MSTKDQRTEGATPHKLQEERKRGNIFRDREIVIAGVFFFEIVFIKWNLSAVFGQFRDYYYRLFDESVPPEFSIGYVQGLTTGALMLIIRVVGPLALLALALSFVGNVAQGGWNLAFEPLQLNPARVLPKNNFTRIFSGIGLFGLIKNLALFLIIARLGWLAIAGVWPKLPTWTLLSPQESNARTLGIVYDLAWDTALALIVVSAVHYYFQRQRFARDLRMTKQEVRDEYKQLEGNPIIKGRIRRLQMQLSRRRMMQEVPAASVVITNPTHYAVALRYDPQTMQAPKVVAKGRGWLALRIRAVAETNHVPIVENKPLAQLLYKKVEIDETIPVELYRAVAEILAYLMKAREAFAT